MATHQILASATQNARLLSILSRTDHAPSEYAQIKQYQSSIENIVTQQKRRVKALAAASAKEYQEHEEYQESTIKRLVYKLSGRKHKFIEKEEEEHREWLNAIQNELEAKRHLDHLNETLEDVKSKASLLRPMVEEHNAAQVELDKLYNSIFSGPSPDFPTEDTKEHRLSLAKESFDEAQLRLSTESNVLSILQNALTVMNQCVGRMDDVLRSSSMDAWGIGGGFADMTERSSLAQAQSLSSRVEMLVTQAQEMQPAVQTLGPMNIAQGSLISDVIFDNGHSDVKFNDTIEEANRQVVAARVRLIQEIKYSSERLINFRGEVKEEKKILELRRIELQDERATVFEGVVASGGMSDNSHQPRSIVQVEHDQPEWESPSVQWDGQQYIHYSLFGGGYQEQFREPEPGPEPEPYLIPPAGTYGFQSVDPNYQKDLSMPVPSWYT
ncbi:hypothetical protein MFRU_008g03990 [Monilinia fructicola]|uniref:Uncharacterized protein n=1 Tax=Monilinia fructicola TaxID=38448 RepID=A0A5M9J5M8_MONFR|nr:hypothetical protein EYC84_010530 [Monilinia fructicola]KAG4032049.1 hypothetical protein MFRU_008g03990 [Monilinia fructicola]